VSRCWFTRADHRAAWLEPISEPRFFWTVTSRPRQAPALNSLSCFPLDADLRRRHIAGQATPRGRTQVQRGCALSGNWPG